MRGRKCKPGIQSSPLSQAASFSAGGSYVHSATYSPSSSNGSLPPWSPNPSNTESPVPGLFEPFPSPSPRSARSSFLDMETSDEFQSPPQQPFSAPPRIQSGFAPDDMHIDRPGFGGACAGLCSSARPNKFETLEILWIGSVVVNHTDTLGVGTFKTAHRGHLSLMHLPAQGLGQSPNCLVAVKRLYRKRHAMNKDGIAKVSRFAPADEHSRLLQEANLLYWAASIMTFTSSVVVTPPSTRASSTTIGLHASSWDAHLLDGGVMVTPSSSGSGGGSKTKPPSGPKSRKRTQEICDHLPQLQPGTVQTWG
ncbi:hypothetical protein B0H10DRAFT_1949020 [Mycena sp. CBHHK59/15]|nr:hypothetical protein B0H10DRAFT_1949020 [Mycena sp. CBHHK59/15]